MTSPTLLGLATVTPPYQHRQMDLHDQWLLPYIHSQRARAIFAAAAIDTRYSVLPDAAFLADEPSTKIRNDRYMQAARPLAAEVIGRALAQANLTPADINHFIVVSCTGFDDPGLDVLLASDLGMRSNLRRSALIGMGCQAGLTGLDRTWLEVTARPASHVLLLAVELGTLHFQHGKKLDNMVAAALFGDGLAAAVIGAETVRSGLKPDLHPKIVDTLTHSDYAAQELLGFHVSDKGYEIRLSTRVPEILRDLVPEVVTSFLGRSNLNKNDIRFWGIHPGGAKIVDFVGEALALAPADLRYSREILRQYGNMSSATIFFVLNEITRQGQPQSGDYALLLAFGPGLTIELCLIRW
jgi:alkylresorcinol/alkylpyrone synthase